ncbi:MAG TPA: MFS transporter [Candidatus Elarobacter sp.]
MSPARSPAAPITPNKPSADDGLPLPRRRIAFAAIALGIIMSTLDGSIANTALPTIARELHASPSESIWVVNGFQLAVTASLLTCASLGDLVGGARVYRFGTVLFILGSLACALSRTLPVLIASRAVQGLGAAAIMAISPALVREIFPRKQLGRAVGWNALVVGAGTASGPTIGGLLLAVLAWPWLFAINVPLGIANVLLNRALPEDERGDLRRLDLPSAALSAIGLASTIWGLDGFSRAEPGWTIAARIIIGVGALVAFVLRQRGLARPMIALDLFRIPRFAFAGATSVATFAAQGIAYVSLPFFFQVGLGQTPLESGLLLTAWPIGIVFSAPLAGRLSDRIFPGALATGGLAVLTIGLALYASLGEHPSTLAIVSHGLLCGIGYGFFQSPNNRELLGSAPREKSASAGGFLATFRLSGQTFGAALLAIVFGAYGASLESGAAHDAIVRATPPALWIACAFAGIATVASALRLRYHADSRRLA